MHSFEELSELFKEKFEVAHFPAEPATLYNPNNYFLSIGGKRVRPVMCLMGNELFGDIIPDCYQVATAIELFHNFTLIHDDIMDKAPLRRGMQTVHEKYDASTALLAGDVMLVRAYDYLNNIKTIYIHRILHLFNKTAKEVCEGQQLDMDFEKQEQVSMEQYLKMIELKTSVSLAASLQSGAIPIACQQVLPGEKPAHFWIGQSPALPCAVAREERDRRRRVGRPELECAEPAVEELRAGRLRSSARVPDGVRVRAAVQDNHQRRQPRG